MDSATLRSILLKTDGSAQAIHRAAGAMMKFYDKGAVAAVAEWQNALLQAEPHQLLPLLYVANEVLQNSKRNRGTKFLEAFSPILGNSLITMVQRDAALLDKVRRTTKIWGDRRVFSVRFVGDLLQGLDPYRREQQESAARFSPQADHDEEEEEEEQTPKLLEKSSRSTSVDDNDDDIKALVSTSPPGSEEEEESEEEDEFAPRESSDSLGHLDVSLHINKSAFLNSGPATKKRRRNSSLSHGKRRKSILSTSSLMELWNQVATLQEGLESSQALLREVAASPSSVDIDQLVGDELLEEYKKVVKEEKMVKQQKKTLHKIAQDRKALESQAVKYIPWLENSLKNDDEDIRFCLDLQEKIKLYQHVHGVAQKAREERRQKELVQRQKEEEERRKREEEEERKKFMDEAMKKEEEAKPGMVWSRERQEYIYLNTDESWRD